MNRRFAAYGVLICSATLAVLVTRSATADAPDEQGWWQVTNPGGLPATSPSAPDVPADGLLVQGGPQSPSAYAALDYAPARGVTANRLTLKVAPHTAATPSATLLLCSLRSPSFSPEQGGPMSDAPAYDCREKVSGSLDSTGSSFTFNVSSLVPDGSLTVAILPGDPTTRVVLSKPDNSSLQTEPGVSTSASWSAGSGSTGTTGAPAATGSAPSSAAAAAPALPSQPVAAPTDGGHAPVVAPGASAAAAPSGAPAINASPVSATLGGGSVMPRVVGGLVIAGFTIAVVLWAFAGGSRRADVRQP